MAKKFSPEASSKVQRWQMYIQTFEFDIEYTESRNNIADLGSRLELSTPSSSEDSSGSEPHPYFGPPIKVKNVEKPTNLKGDTIKRKGVEVTTRSKTGSLPPKRVNLKSKKERNMTSKLALRNGGQSQETPHDKPPIANLSPKLPSQVLPSQIVKPKMSTGIYYNDNSDSECSIDTKTADQLSMMATTRPSNNNQNPERLKQKLILDSISEESDSNPNNLVESAESSSEHDIEPTQDINNDENESICEIKPQNSSSLSQGHPNQTLTASKSQTEMHDLRAKKTNQGSPAHSPEANSNQPPDQNDSSLSLGQSNPTSTASNNQTDMQDLSAQKPNQGSPAHSPEASPNQPLDHYALFCENDNLLEMSDLAKINFDSTVEMTNKKSKGRPPKKISAPQRDTKPYNDQCRQLLQEKKNKFWTEHQAKDKNLYNIINFLKASELPDDNKEMRIALQRSKNGILVKNVLFYMEDDDKTLQEKWGDT